MKILYYRSQKTSLLVFDKMCYVGYKFFRKECSVQKRWRHVRMTFKSRGCGEGVSPTLSSGQNQPPIRSCSIASSGISKVAPVPPEEDVGIASLHGLSSRFQPSNSFSLNEFFICLIILPRNISWRNWLLLSLRCILDVDLWRYHEWSRKVGAWRRASWKARSSTQQLHHMHWPRTEGWAGHSRTPNWLWKVSTTGSSLPSFPDQPSLHQSHRLVGPIPYRTVVSRGQPIGRPFLFL